MALFIPVSPGRSGRSGDCEEGETNEDGFVHAQLLRVGLNYLGAISFPTFMGWSLG
jgi:hypothetical protein